LDTKKLDIKTVSTDNLEPLNFKLLNDKEVVALGVPLQIDIGRTLKEGETITINITYITSPDAMAAQWLKASQTFDKKYPFFYTQGEAINSRSILPCQDTPSLKVDVKAELTVKKPLVALLAGLKLDVEVIDGKWITYFYKVPNRIPTYLIAIAAGDLVYKKITERTGVWAERSIVEAAANEFVDAEKFIQTVI
jgi:aminopeptidase N